MRQQVVLHGVPPYVCEGGGLAGEYEDVRRHWGCAEGLLREAYSGSFCSYISPYLLPAVRQGC